MFQFKNSSKLIRSLALLALLCICVLSFAGCAKDEKLTRENYDPYTYDKASPIAYQCGIARVWQLIDNTYLYGFINESGEVVIPCIYTNTSNNFEAGKYIVVEIDDRFGVITTDGDTVVDCEYDSVYIEDGKYIIVESKDQSGVITTAGDTIVDCEYDSVYIADGVAYLEKNGESTKLILETEQSDDAVLDEIDEELEAIQEDLEEIDF